MRFSYNWLKTFFSAEGAASAVGRGSSFGGDKKFPLPQEIAELLIFHSFEVEEVIPEGDDTLFEISILPNRRHDCLSHRGVAREIAVLTGTPLARDPFSEEVPEWNTPNELTATVEDEDGCPRYMAALLHGVSVSDSPDWLKNRLRAVGQKPINNIVDATNFVMFALGQPLHAFDADAFVKKNNAAHIIVRSAEDGEVITTLGGEEHELRNGDMVIADGESDVALGIAGVKGGVAAEISKKTKNIIIESANFNPARVRATATRLGLRTDASARFESGLAPEQAACALKEVVMLIEKLTGAALQGVADERGSVKEKSPIPLSPAEINGLLGTNIDIGVLEEVLSELDFFHVREGSGMLVTPPPERLDVLTKEDLIEEVGRVYGYEKIKAVPLLKTDDSPIVNKNFYYTEKIRDILVGLGYSEVYTHAIGGEGEAVLANPLAQDKTFLRATLVNKQFETAVSQNEKNKEMFSGGEVKMFEIGKVFSEAGEHWALALANGDAKEFFAVLEAGEPEPESREGAIASYNLDDIIAKFPEPPTEYTPYQKPEIEPRYRPVSPYPFVLRDIAVFVPEGTGSAAVRELIRNEAGALLADARLFDEFKKDGKVSYAFRLVFQSHEKTLSDDEVNEIMARVTNLLNGQDGFSVR